METSPINQINICDDKANEENLYQISKIVTDENKDDKTLNIFEHKEQLTQFFLSEIDFKIYNFLDSESVINLMLTSKLMYDGFRNKLIYKYFKSIFPSLSKVSSVTKLWIILLSNQALEIKNPDDDLIIKRKSNSTSSKNFMRSSSYRHTNQIKSEIKYDDIPKESFYSTHKSLKPNNNGTNIIISEFNIIDNKVNDNKNFINQNQIGINESTELKSSKIFSEINIGINTKASSSSLSSVVIEAEKSNNNLKTILDAIGRDVSRTFHYGRFLEDSGKEDLKTILSNIAIENRYIGYCQGMNFVAGALLELTNSTESATFIFQKLLDNYDVYYLYIEVRFYLSKCQIILSEFFK